MPLSVSLALVTGLLMSQRFATAVKDAQALKTAGQSSRRIEATPQKKYLLFINIKVKQVYIVTTIKGT